MRNKYLLFICLLALLQGCSTCKLESNSKQNDPKKSHPQQHHNQQHHKDDSPSPVACLLLKQLNNFD